MARVDDERGGASAPIGASGDSRALDRDIWAMAWPAMLSFMLTNVVDLIDIALVGRLGRQSIAAFGYAAQCNHMVQMLIQSVGIGCVALMSRAVGAGRPERARQALAGSLFVAQGISALAIVAVMIFPRAILRLLDADEAVIETAVPYFRLVIGASLLFSVSFMFESALRAHKLTQAPMRIAFVVMAVKGVTSAGLIFGLFGLPRLDLAGAGASTVIAYLIGMGLYLVISKSVAREGLSTTFGLEDVLAIGQSAREVLRISLPAIGERLLMSLALLTYFAILSQYGTSAVAAYAIGVRLLSFSWVPGRGFSAAASTFVGQALGAHDSAGARRAGRRSIVLAVTVMSVLGAVCLVARGPLARLFTSDAEVVAELLPFMLMLGIAQPFMGAHFTLGGVLRGAGDTVTPLFGAALGNWVFRVPLALLFAKVLHFDVEWVWAALVTDHFTRMLFNGSAFLRGRWAEDTGVSAAPVKMR